MVAGILLVMSMGVLNQVLEINAFKVVGFFLLESFEWSIKIIYFVLF